jgi:hypothetical protein
MLANLRQRLTYANIMATLAVFISLGGSSYAVVKINGKNIKNRTIAGTKLKNNTVGGKQVNEATLGRVPSAARAESAASADRATTSDNATNAGTLDGIDSTNFLSSAPPEPYHEVGAPGEPPFATGWSNTGGTTATAAFFKDPFGVVHLKGDITRTGGAITIFKLPEGYRPTKSVCFPTFRYQPTQVAGYNCILDNGELEQSSNAGDGGYLLDGVSFRAGAG